LGATLPKPLLCVTVTAPTTAELRALRDGVADADLIELRLDMVRDPDVAGALAGRRRPVIITCRPIWEGGHFSGSEEERKRLLGEALALGAEYVDIEWRAGFDDLIGTSGGRRVVLSTHDFDGVAPDLAARLQAMRATGAGVLKLAVLPKQLSDCIPLLALAAQGTHPGDVVLIGMGEYGLPTRVLPGRFGSKWTYAGLLHDIGQLSAASLLTDYHFRSLDADTGVYGLAARSVGHSVSPAMHNAAIRATAQNAVYLPLPAVSADDFVAFGRAIGIKGASVTIPYKVSLFERVDEVDEVAREIGAINTIRVADDGRWMGGNTDVSGFLQPLQDRVPLDGMRAAVLGAGGAARAVAVALTSSGCSVRLHARNRTKAAETAARTAAGVGPWPPEPGSWDLLVNCTPVGMQPRTDETPVPAGLLTGRYVYDLVYNPAVTRLLRDAAAVGCETIGGLDMLVAQAREQFRWWTGSTPAAAVMREAAVTRLAECARDEHHVV
jgi:3-dehydroquinate dehydratase/shikimate dehydrogenase